MSDFCFSETCGPDQLPKARTGIQGLDEITGSDLPRGRPTLVAGSAGSGKTMLAMDFLAHGAVEFDEPGVFLAFDESREDLVQNFRSIGLDLDTPIAEKKLAIDYLHLNLVSSPGRRVSRRRRRITRRRLCTARRSRLAGERPIPWGMHENPLWGVRS